MRMATISLLSPAFARSSPATRKIAHFWCPAKGVQVGNGTTAPYTVIDERAHLTGHVNGQINVKAPPYLAKGDGATDDTAAIQSAINAGCASAGKQPEVYLPAMPGGLSYKITSPLLIN